MADKKLNTGPAENISPEAAEPIATPEQAAASEPQQEQTGPAIPEPGDVVVSFDKINELMAEKRQNARAEVEKAETPETPEAAAPGETPQPANTEEPKKSRRGRPPKAEKAATENQKAEKSAGARKGRPPKADKAAPDKPKPSKRDKVSRSDGKAPDAKEPINEKYPNGQGNARKMAEMWLCGNQKNLSDRGRDPTGRHNIASFDEHDLGRSGADSKRKIPDETDGGR